MIALIGAETQQPGSSLLQFAPLVLIAVVFYFMLIRPQKRRAQAQRSLVNAVEEGDEVMTASGIFGTVTEIDEDEGTVMIEVASGIQVKMLRDAIRTRLVEDEDDEDDEDDSEAEEADSTP